MVPKKTMSEQIQNPYTENWFDHNIPHWEQWLGSFRDKVGIRALEIGSFEGRSTAWLCQHILTGTDARIDCVDLFALDPVYGDYHARFRHNTAAFADRVVEHVGYSFDCLRRIEGEFDFIYIDGWHSAFGTLADAVMTWPLLKTDGVMIFDDYLWVPPKQAPPKPNALVRTWAKLRGRDWRREALERRIAAVPAETPKLGVDGLLATLVGHYELLGVTNQLAVRKTSGFDQGQMGHDT
jgi:predicted O-methyltransferase YrrM